MQTVKERIAQNMRDAGKRYHEDLLAMNASDLESGPGGAARAPLDFSYEVAYVNDRIAARFRGEDPGPFARPEGGWVCAPAEIRTKEQVAELIKDSTEKMASAWESLDDIHRTIETPGGNTTMLEMALLGCIHLNYHDGQLNYVQSLKGDNEMHWT